MKKIIDSQGNLVKNGDVLIECTGWRNGEYYNKTDKVNYFKIWQFNGILDGHGYNYYFDKKKYRFAWTDVRKSIKIEFKKLPKSFKLSFFNGLNYFYSSLSNGNFTDIINNSDWEDRKIKKEDVDNYKSLKKIKLNTIDDIKKNIDIIERSRFIPTKIIGSVLVIGNANSTKIINDENLEDWLKYKKIINLIKYEIDENN